MRKSAEWIWKRRTYGGRNIMRLVNWFSIFESL